MDGKKTFTETEELRKERREKDRARNKRPRETDNHKKRRLATLKRMKRGDENELERKLRMEKMVATTQLKLAMET